MYHAHLKSITRKTGASAVASAAYRACEKIEDKRTGLVHDYRRKRHHQSGGICTPNGEPAPDRAALWNEAEAVELRGNSTVAQEWEIALPNSLDSEQQAALAQDLAQMIATQEGTVADWHLHKPQARPVVGQEQPIENPHVHIMHPTRKWSEGHLLRGRLDRVNNLLSTDDRKAKGLSTSRTEDVKAMREQIAVVINRHLQAAGLDERVDHRSYAERGLAREPQQHMGKAATAMERRGIRTELGDINRAIAKAALQATASEPTHKPTMAENVAKVLSDLGIDDEQTIKPRPSSTSKKPAPKKEYKAQKIERPELPQLPLAEQMPSLVSRDQLEAAADLSADFPKPDNMSFADYWAQIREAIAKQQAELTEAQKDLLASAVTDAENPSHHPTDEIRAAIIARYGDTAEARLYADLLERQGRSDASIVVERHDELRHIDD